MTGRSRRIPAIAAAIAAAGLIGAALVAADAAMSRTETFRLLAWAVGTAIIGGLGVALVLRWTRRSGLAVQIAVLACSVAVVVIAGAWFGARSMFLSAHDLDVLAVLLIAAGAVTCVIALLLGDRLARASEELAGAARQLGDGTVLSDAAPAASGELEVVARELERTSRRLDEARRNEQRLETSRRELVAWVSHDLRTPLAGIMAVAEALEDGIASDDDMRARYYSTLRTETGRLARLVDDLFELSRAQAGVLKLTMERISLDELVADAIAGVSPVAEAKGVHLEGRVAQPPPELAGSSPELLRALRNILENAVRHTPADGSVVVEAGATRDGARVSVLDDGGGVAPDDLERLFEVGYRADAARTPGGGAGLGLAIARSFVEAHAGRITVSNEGRGARFTMWLPLDPTAV